MAKKINIGLEFHLPNVAKNLQETKQIKLNIQRIEKRIYEDLQASNENGGNFLETNDGKQLLFLVNNLKAESDVMNKMFTNNTVM